MEMSKVLVANPPEKKCRALFAFVNLIANLGEKSCRSLLVLTMAALMEVSTVFLQYSLFCVLAEMWNFHKHLLSFSLLLNNFYF